MLLPYVIRAIRRKANPVSVLVRWHASDMNAETKAKALYRLTTSTGALAGLVWTPPGKMSLWNATGIDFDAGIDGINADALKDDLFVADLTDAVKAPFADLAFEWTNWFNDDSYDAGTDLLHAGVAAAMSRLINIVDGEIRKYESGQQSRDRA